MLVWAAIFVSNAIVAFGNMFRQRLRIFFTKEGLSRFLGHHDLMRLFERALRRVGLPLAYSAGFNPRPQISFPVALALGCVSKQEVLEVELVRWTSPRPAKDGLQREMPEGIGITSVHSVDVGDKAEVTGTEFCVEMGDVPVDFASRLTAFIEKDEALVERMSKSGAKVLNVRRFVDYARFNGSALVLGLKVTTAGAARPQEVLQALLQCPPEALPPMRLTRTRLTIATPPHPSGELNVEKSAHQHERPGGMPDCRGPGRPS